LKNYQKIRVENVDKSGEFAPTFYNQRLLNQFKRLLKKNKIHFISHDKGKTIIIDRFCLVIKGNENDGRFYAYSKQDWPRISFSFTANSTNELIVKLMKFKLLPYRVAGELKII
jgi:hypothetical protein